MVLNPPSPCTRAFWCYWWGWGGCPVSSLLGSFLPIMTTNYSKCPFQKLRLSQRATTIVIPLVAQVESHTEFVLKNDSVDSLEKREDFALPFTLRKKKQSSILQPWVTIPQGQQLLGDESPLKTGSPAALAPLGRALPLPSRHTS